MNAVGEVGSTKLDCYDLTNQDIYIYTIIIPEHSTKFMIGKFQNIHEEVARGPWFSGPWHGGQ